MPVRARFRRALPLHQAIIEAVQRHDPEAGEAAALRLLEDTAKNIRHALREVAVSNRLSLPTQDV